MTTPQRIKIKLNAFFKKNKKEKKKEGKKFPFIFLNYYYFLK